MQCDNLVFLPTPGHLLNAALRAGWRVVRSTNPTLYLSAGPEGDVEPLRFHPEAYQAWAGAPTPGEAPGLWELAHDVDEIERAAVGA
jgi:hypothetical protein